MACCVVEMEQLPGPELEAVTSPPRAVYHGCTIVTGLVNRRLTRYWQDGLTTPY